MSDNTSRTILGLLLMSPALITTTDELDANLFSGRERETFQAISDIWEQSQPEIIDPALLAKKLKGKDTLTYISGLMDGLVSASPAAFQEQVAALVKEKLTREIYQKIGEQSESNRLDISEIRPLIYQLEVAGNKEKRIADAVRNWIDDPHTVGEFGLGDVYAIAGATTDKAKSNVRQALARMVNEAKIQHVPRRYGRYRKIEVLANPIDVMGIVAEPLDLYLPLGLDKLVYLYPKSIIVCSGSSNRGKTTLALDMVKGNMTNNDVRYFFTEGGAEELKARLVQHEDVAIEDWTMLAFEHNGCPADVIEPDAINVYDYLHVGDQFWMIDELLNDIHKKLNKGIAFINIQKSKFKELGDGGEFGLRIPRLYFTLNPNPSADYNDPHCQHVVARIAKAKGWKAGLNPDGRILPFSIRDGWKIECSGSWEYPESYEAARPKKKLY